MTRIDLQVSSRKLIVSVLLGSTYLALGCGNGTFGGSSATRDVRTSSSLQKVTGPTAPASANSVSTTSPSGEPSGKSAASDPSSNVKGAIDPALAKCLETWPKYQFTAEQVASAKIIVADKLNPNGPTVDLNSEDDGIGGKPQIYLIKVPSPDPYQARRDEVLKLTLANNSKGAYCVQVTSPGNDSTYFERAHKDAERNPIMYFEVATTAAVTVLGVDYNPVIKPTSWWEVTMPDKVTLRTRSTGVIDADHTHGSINFNLMYQSIFWTP